jgi:hypothetical protein
MPEEHKLPNSSRSASADREPVAVDSVTYAAIMDKLNELSATGASHNKWLESIDGRFRTLNGTVARLTEENIASKIFESSHAKTVDQLAEVGKIVQTNREAIASNVARLENEIAHHTDMERTQREVDDGWKLAIKPYLDWLIKAAIIMLLLNGKDILEALKKVL